MCTECRRPFCAIFPYTDPANDPILGYHIFIDRILRGEPIIIYGDGEQTRGNTYIADCVGATVSAATCASVGEIYNIGGGEARSVNWVIAKLQELSGRRVQVRHAPPRLGDQRHTLATIDKARRNLG